MAPQSPQFTTTQRIRGPCAVLTAGQRQGLVASWLVRRGSVTKNTATATRGVSVKDPTASPWQALVLRVLRRLWWFSTPLHGWVSTGRAEHSLTGLQHPFPPGSVVRGCMLQPSNMKQRARGTARADPASPSDHVLAGLGVLTAV